MSEEKLAASADAKGVRADSAGPHSDPVDQHPSNPTFSRRMRWFPPLAAALGIVGVLALFTYGLVKSSEGTTLVSQIAAGKKPLAPEFKLEVFWPQSGSPTRAVASASPGGVLDLNRLRGRPVVLNFWASWCVACRAEAALLNTAAATNPGTVFVGIDVQDLRGDATGFLRRYHVSYTAVADKTNSTYERYGLTGVPETYYIDSRGRIVAHDPGPVTVETLMSGIRSARR